MSTDTITFQLDDGENSDEFEVPATLIDALRDGGEGAPEVVGDLAIFALAQQAHGLLHHGHGNTPDGFEDAESEMMDVFEERFGETYAEMTGHDH